MSNKFLISDTHFGHTNVIKYESRPFETVELMNCALIKAWNNHVSRDDVVYHLGDFSLTNKEKTTEIVRQLNGHIILIMGNHDRGHSRKWWLDTGIDEVIEYPIIIDDFYILSHEPVYLNGNIPYKNIHGHLHSSKRKLEYPNHGEDMYINVCVEHIGYAPININDVK